MLDFITSKIAMMIAAIIILGSVLGIYALQREQAKDLEIQNIADKISGTIHDLNTLLGETKFNVTFDSGKEGVYVKPSVNGKNYDILISQYRVILTLDQRHYSSEFVGPIHLWAPEYDAYNLTQIQFKDGENRTLELTSGEDFKIERKLVEINGENEYGTFVYV